jgi:DNA-binding NtrC family response regulator
MVALRIPPTHPTRVSTSPADRAIETGIAPKTLLFVDDEPANLQLFRLQLDERYRILTANDGGEALSVLDREDVDAVLSDERMPGMRGVDLLARVFERWPDVGRMIVSAYSDADRLMLAMNRGHAHEYVLKPWNIDDLRASIERCLALVEHRRLLQRDAGLGQSLAADERSRRPAEGLVGADGGLRRTVELARRAAQSDATVLLLGETGTGKEFFAGFIHEVGQRAANPFVRVNCGVLAEGVLESELFGHEQGAFTGALRARKGRFEVADGGTLFLDEIGDISPKFQVSLLRILQERSFERVGGSKTVTVDVRVIAATHRALGAAVKAGRFREDLFFRLNVVPIEIPPLRERREDIQPLVEHFIRKHAHDAAPRAIEPSALEALRAYDWPGNVRELENLVQRALILSVGEELTLEDFCIQLQAPAAPATSAREEGRGREADRIRDAIVGNGGNLARAARMLGIPRTTLVSRAAKLGLL